MIEGWEQVFPKSPHDQSLWVKITARIRLNATGETREYQTEGIWDSDSRAPETFIWEEGNYACDCNRELFFKQGEDVESRFCSSDRYSLELVNPVDGKIFYSEFEEAT